MAHKTSIRRPILEIMADGEEWLRREIVDCLGDDTIQPKRIGNTLERLKKSGFIKLTGRFESASATGGVAAFYQITELGKSAVTNGGSIVRRAPGPKPKPKPKPTPQPEIEMMTDDEKMMGLGTSKSISIGDEGVSDEKEKTESPLAASVRKTILQRRKYRSFRIVSDGDGVVAEGIEFGSGVCVLSMISQAPVVTIYPNLRHMENAVIGGSTDRIEFDDLK